jgi:glycine hydroxymethyltransferase
VTRRGFKEAEVALLTEWMCDILDDIKNESVIDAVREKVKALCARFPVYKSA